MGRTGSDENKQANTELQQQQAQSYKNASEDRTNYNNYVSGIEAKGNPFESEDYKQNEGLLASEGAGAANASALEGVDNAVGRTGTNTASEPYYRAMMAKDRMRSQGSTLVGQRADDTRNAAQWQQWLAGAKLGAGSIDTSTYGTATSGRSSALNNLTQLGLASYAPIGSAVGAAGTAAGGYLGRK